MFIMFNLPHYDNQMNIRTPGHSKLDPKRARIFDWATSASGHLSFKHAPSYSPLNIRSMQFGHITQPPGIT